jgi:CTP synthase (UTP-ammonia lyase)
MRVGIIGEFDKNSSLHILTNQAIEHSRATLNFELQTQWISTEHVEKRFKQIVNYDGFWIAPGSPYKNMKGALDIIQYARINKIPIIGTCGGFQHMIIEFARNVLNIKDSGHQEYDPYASKLIISRLNCNLKGRPLDVKILNKESLTYSIFKSKAIKEKYYCNFGLNPEFQSLFNKNSLKIVGSDGYKEARIVELENHPFFIATLFVPQDNSTFKKPHKLITKFLIEVEKYQSSKNKKLKL